MDFFAKNAIFAITKQLMLKPVPIPKTLTLTSNKAHATFGMTSFFEKLKGGGKPSISKKRNFFSLAEISGRKSGREQKKSADHKFRPYFIPTLNDFHFG